MSEMEVCKMREAQQDREARILTLINQYEKRDAQIAISSNVLFVLLLVSWLVVPILPAVVLALLRQLDIFRNRRLLKQITEMRHPFALKILLNVLRDGKPTDKADALDAIRHVLPLVEQVPAEPYSRESCRNLHILLQQHDPAVVMSALRILGRIGNTGSLDPMKRIMNITQPGSAFPTAIDPGVREVAQVCYHRLYERIEMDKQAATLLRPAHVPDDTLLRPANGAHREVDDKLLLRSIDSSDNDS